MHKLKCKICSTIFYDEMNGRWVQNCPKCHSWHYFDLSKSEQYRNPSKHTKKLMLLNRIKCVENLLAGINDIKLEALLERLKKEYRKLKL